MEVICFFYRWLFAVLHRPPGSPKVERILKSSTELDSLKFKGENYTLIAYARSCQYRNKTLNKWVSNPDDEVIFDDNNTLKVEITLLQTN